MKPIRMFYAAERTDHLLGRICQRKVDIERERHNDRVRRENDTEAPPADNKMKLPGDPAAARGVPIAGFPGGFGGAIRGTRPGTRPGEELK